MKKDKKRRVSNVEVYEKPPMKKGKKTFVDHKSKKNSTDYRKKTSYIGPETGVAPPPFDFEARKEITAGPKKGRCGFESSQSVGPSFNQGSNSSVSSYAVSSFPSDPDNRINELTKELEEVRAHAARMEEVVRRRVEECQRREEDAMRREEDARRIEEEARKKVEENTRMFELAMEENKKRTNRIQEMLHQMFQEIKYRNHQSPVPRGPGKHEQEDHLDKYR